MTKAECIQAGIYVGGVLRIVGELQAPIGAEAKRALDRLGEIMAWIDGVEEYEDDED